jgi:two-component system nitrate/nitrite sensor histidine kinase NarX
VEIIRSEINKLTHLLIEEQSGVLRFGGARMALLDIEAGFWGLRRQMEAMVGHHLTDNAMQQAGANGGASFARAFAPDVTGETACTEQFDKLSTGSAEVAASAFCDCVAAYQLAGFGRFEVEIREWPIGRVLVHGRDAFEPWMMRQHNQQIDHPACAYTSGVFVGFINALTNRRDIVCIQHTCQAQGAATCLFELLPAAEADRTAVVAFDPNPGLTNLPMPVQQTETNELFTLLAVTQNVASTLDLEPLLGLILDQFKAIVDYDGASILIQEGELLKVLAYRGPISQADALQLRFPLSGAGAIQAVIQRREPVIISDVRGESSLAHAFRKTTGTQLTDAFGYVRSWMGIPLIVRDEVIGMLSMDHHHPDAYAGRHSLLALTIANKVAVAIENARLYQAEQERRRELQTLLDVTAAANSSLNLDEMLATALDRLATLPGVSRAGVLLVNDATGELEPRMIRPARTIAAEELAEMVRACQAILASGESLYMAPDAAQGHLEPGAFILLHIRSRTLGLIAIIGETGSQFNQGQLALFKSIADQLGVAVENARLYEQAQQAAVTEERHRLARELHDAVTQTLFSASLTAEVLPRIWERDQQLGEQRLEDLRELTRGALAEMRALLLELRPATLTETSLGDLLHQLREAFVGRARLAIDLVVEGERPLPPDVQIAFYRIAQETLNNVTKHAGADAVTIRLQFLPELVQMMIQDNGRGFDVGDIPPNSLGVGIMRERAGKIGAAIQIDSQVGIGTAIIVRWDQ